MSKINSGWVRKQTTVLLSMTLALAPVVATPALAADAEGGNDVTLEQSVETESEKDAEQSVEQGEQSVEQTGAAKDSAPKTDDNVTPQADAIAEVTNATGNSVGTYETLAEAIVAVPEGGTVTLLKDTTGSGVKVEESKKFTLDLGGHTYTVTNPTVGSAGTETNGFQLLQGSTITIKNGAITASTSSAKILIQNYSNLTLDDVDLIGLNSTQYVLSNNCGEVHIGKDTTISAAEGQVAFDVCRFSTYPSVQVTIDEGAGAIVGKIEVSDSGGTGTGAFSLNINGGDLSNAQLVYYNENDCVVEKSPSVSLPSPDGYQWIDGSLKETGDPHIKTVASITDADDNDTYFSTLSAAIDAALEDQTVALLGNVTESVTIPEGKNVTLDLAGNTLTNTDKQHTVTVNEGATLTVTDSSEGKTGVIDNVSHARGALVNEGTVTVESGTLTRSEEAGKSPSDNGGNSWYVVDNQGTMTFDGGTVTSTGKYSSLIRNLNGTLTINDGEFKNGFIALKNDDGGTLEVKGGTVSSDDQAVQNWSSAEISGGTLNGSVIAWDYGEGGNSTMTISGNAVIKGDVKAVNYLDAKQGPTVNITGGTITGEVSKGTHDGTSGIQPADPADESSQIAISGGTFTGGAPDEALIVPGSGLTKNPDGTFGIHEHVGTAIAAKEPTCTEAGNTAHWVCSECGELFADEGMTQPTTLEAVTIGATGHQSVTHVAAKDATETEAGNREYWHCADCGRYFLDAALTKETTLAAVTIPAKGQEPVETHTVTLVLGTGEPNRTIEVADGEALTQIAAPTYPGYTFLAWYADADLTVKYDLAAPVTGDLTLYAGWTKDGEKDDSTTTPEKGAEKEEKSDGLAETGDATLAAPVVASAAAGVLALATARRLRGRDEK